MEPGLSAAQACVDRQWQGSRDAVSAEGSEAGVSERSADVLGAGELPRRDEEVGR
jgi:hypothetical protein